MNSGETIQSLQNTGDNLRLLVAQRRIYRTAKRLNAAHVVAVSVLAVGGPIVTAATPGAAPWVAAVTGLWLFLTRTLIRREVETLKDRAAGVQELFDIRVLGLTPNTLVWQPPEPEAIEDAAGPGFMERVEEEKLRDWYSIAADTPPAAAVLICQRSNTMYSARLQLKHAQLWPAALAVWAVVMSAIAVARSATFAEVLVGSLLPILPSTLDVVDLRVEAQRARESYQRLTRSIVEALDELPIDSNEDADHRRFQDEILSLRRHVPLVPEFLYRQTRPSNERAMTAGADDLAQDVRRRM
ncbi:MAG: hypothetical protein CL424_17900 [Acidimicrobiaceae bacterium]|nr:hypothetical protein [Acidimicrobiaceae bacterium]